MTDAIVRSQLEAENATLRAQLAAVERERDEAKVEVARITKTEREAVKDLAAALNECDAALAAKEQAERERDEAREDRATDKESIKFMNDELSRIHDSLNIDPDDDPVRAIAAIRENCDEAEFRAEQAKAALAGAVEDKDEAYRQRNHLVAALARLFPSGVRATNIEGWSPDWHGCVYIDLPSGQISYHYHDSQAHLFAGLPPYDKPWDGHDKKNVHARLAALPDAALSAMMQEADRG